LTGILPQKQDRDAYHFLVEGRDDWETFFFHWRQGGSRAFVGSSFVPIGKVVMPQAPCFHLGLLRLLRATSSRSAGVDASIIELARQLPIPDGVSQKQDSLRIKFQRCLDKADAINNRTVYATVQDDEVKRAYLLQSVYEPAMELAPKKRKGVHKPGQNTTK
jgi:hypothetical protein